MVTSTQPATKSSPPSTPTAVVPVEDPIWVPGPYRMESIPGKGKGLLATEALSPGTLILAESPLFTTASLTSAATQEADLARIIKSLPKPAQRAFISLHNNRPGKEPFSNLVRSNAYPLGPGASTGGLFPTIARINHACRPNAQQAWNARQRRETVHAIRAIAPGDEITVSYAQAGPRAQRQAALREHFGFACACDACSLPEPQQAAHDAAMVRAQELDAAVGDARTVSLRPEQALRDARALVRLFAEVGVVDQRPARAYFDAFQIAIMHGDQARARVFAERSREERIRCEGREADEVRLLDGLVRKPSSYEGYSKAGRWRTSVDAIPEGLDADAFERWLWREAV